MITNQPEPLTRSNPEEQGVLSEGILSFIDGLEQKKLKMHSLMLIRHGHVIAEGWWAPYEPGNKRHLYSLSKSFNSTAVGFAVAGGLLKVKDRVTSFFPDDLPPAVSENLSVMRVKDLLTMSTGHAMDTTMILFTPGLENWAQAILSMPVDYPPGTHFLYNSGASYLLSAIVQKVTGQTVLAYLTPRLFEPLGISGATWEVCPRGINVGGWGLSLRTEDIARFGLLYAQKGNWNGKQLLPAAWVEEASAAQVRNDGEDRVKEPTDWRQGYGYQFWRCQHGAYRGDGAYGQYCVVIPDQDAVLVMTSETGDMQGILDLAWQYVLPAMKTGPLTAKPAAQALLQKRLASLCMTKPAPKPAPLISNELFGKIYRIDPNETGIQTVSIAIENGIYRFNLRDNLGEHQILCGIGDWVKNQAMMPFMFPSMIGMGFNMHLQKPALGVAMGAWSDPHTFTMTWQYLEAAHSETVTCRFTGNILQMDVLYSLAEPGNLVLTGKETRFTGKQQ